MISLAFKLESKLFGGGGGHGVQSAQGQLLPRSLFANVVRTSHFARHVRMARAVE